MPADWSKVPYLKIPHHTSATGIDTETGGFDPYKNGIVELGAISHDYQGNERGRFHSYINPGDHAVLDPGALEVNGISEDKIRSSPHIKDVLPEFIKFMKEHHEAEANTDKNGKTWVTPKTHLVGHNLGFDIDQITSALRMHAPHLLSDWNQVSRHKHDLQQMSPVYDKQSTLSGLGRIYGIPNKAPHTALGDVDQSLGIYHQQRGTQRAMHNAMREGLIKAPQDINLGSTEEANTQVFASKDAPKIKWINN